MNIQYFAHNGVEHTHTAEATNGTNNVVWIILVTLIVAAVAYAAVKMLNNRSQPAEEDVNEDE